ncbi:AraC family transcriptional regulator [Paenibacillus sp. M1]|uniref:AraC family transcriptional regulator n=1 Tax=Paenibacillus haidiansis TaxID=1574488 RepID=A0ABU7VN18_9BACL
MEHRDWIEAVQRMQDYIEQHLQERITLKALARTAGYSPWHSAKIFKELTGKPPFEYIRSLRLTQAALQLRDDRDKVAEVALDFVFDSHEGFTRAFRKEFGVGPMEYKKAAPPIYLFKPSPIRDTYYPELAKEKLDSPLRQSYYVQVTDFPARKLILKRGRGAEGYFQYVKEVGCDVLGLLCSVKEALYEPVGMWLPEYLRPEGTSVYVQGVEVPRQYDGIVPEGLEILDLPACKMLIFQGEPFEDVRFREAVRNLQSVIRKYDPSAIGYEWADDAAPRFQMEPQGYRGYIEARPVKPI